MRTSSSPRRYLIYNLEQFTPNDASFGFQWHMNNSGQFGGQADADIDAPEAWSIETGSSAVKIGIIDTGVRSDHEDLAGRVSGEPAFDNHGTHVAGIASAHGNNAIGVAGVSWQSLIQVRILRRGGSISLRSVMTSMMP